MDNLDHDLIYKKMQQHFSKMQKRFFTLKWQLEKYIQELRFMADKTDKIHKDCTITKVVASSTSAVSGILSIVGLALAPVTAGASVILFATGLGLGVAAGITSLSAGIIDEVSDSQGRKYLNQVRRKSKVTLKNLAKEANKIVDAVEFRETFLSSFKKPVFISAKWNLGTAGCQSTKYFQSTILTLSKEARIMMGFSVLGDITVIVQDLKHLLKGAKSTTAAELREKAQNLAEKLQELSEIYETLLETFNW